MQNFVKLIGKDLPWSPIFSKVVGVLLYHSKCFSVKIQKEIEAVSN